MEPVEYTLEVIAATVEDAREAEAGGATRLEIVRALDLGGLTPAVETVRAIAAAVSLPLRVMVRETPTYSVGSGQELEELCRAAEAFAGLGVEGLVLGFARGGRVDEETTGRVLACAPGCRATFHRAFEAVRDAQVGLQALRRMPQIDHILMSGGEGTAEERRCRLEELAGLAAPGIAVIAGGIVSASDLPVLRRSGRLREFHAGRAARMPETPVAPVRAEKVRQLAARLSCALNRQ